MSGLPLLPETYEHHERLKTEVKATRGVLDTYDEFGRVYEPDGKLPPLAGRVHSALREFCLRRDEKAQLKKELAKWQHEAEACHQVMDRVIDEWRRATGDDTPGHPLVGDAAREMREMIERLERQNEVLQLALLREQAAAEHVIEAARHHRNDYGARDLDEALRAYDKANA